MAAGHNSTTALSAHVLYENISSLDAAYKFDTTGIVQPFGLNTTEFGIESMTRVFVGIY